MGHALETVRRFYEAFHAEDWATVMDCFAEDVEVDMSRSGLPDLGTYVGHEGVRESWVKWRGAWEDYKVEVEELIPLGDRVVAYTKVSGRSRGQGVETSVKGGDLFTLRDGKISRLAFFPDRDRLRAEAGF